ncbi:glycosyltransferase family 9 protein [Rhodocyclus tenuis]|uniref:ADP-heptose:LPS heptosyltransferase n=1 Tax=Rhodocyclus tenuis TaxID=1066 RepID=A0A840FXU5_RHOTE|nr:glycosyltransferase family 9 protein [Rhodocyclus tenuis]MBB4246634.1 ADP-heptose:LPS heptosyltransferase [Rhodocyclus tenuis]
MKIRSPHRILVVRRDNIGDLVCTTPFLRSLRQALPGAHIAALVNSYNRAVLDGNTDVNEVFSYEKLKHQSRIGGRVLALYARMKLIADMRGRRFDLAILAKPGFDQHGLRMARMAGARRILGFPPLRGEKADGLSDFITGNPEGLHEVEAVALAGKMLGIEQSPGKMRVFPDAGLVEDARRRLEQCGHGVRWLALHISAREKTRRWPLEKFVALIHALADIPDLGFAIFWSPGSANNPMHPGDDEKAAALLQRCSGNKVVAMPTRQLEELNAGIAACDYFLGSDGGAMHVAAGLDLPIVALFENSEFKRTHWYPWQVRHRLLQPQTFAVEDIEEAQVEAAIREIVGG